MNNLINISDFVAPYEIVAPTPEHETRINNIISEFQEIYLEKMIGENAYNDLVLYYDVDQKWIDFINGSQYTGTDGFTKTYKGIKQVLAQLIYFEIMKTFRNIPTTNGQIKPLNETGENVFDMVKCASNWNRAAKYVNYNVYDFLTYSNYDFSIVDFQYFKFLNPLY